jgi:ATP10 protein
MTRCSILTLPIVGLLFVIQRVGAADAAALHSGDMFPQVSGLTLTNRSLDLPAVVSGKPAVIVFSFSRSAGNDARLWNEHLSKDFSNAVLDYQVIVLESVPKLFRGTAVSGIKNTMPAARQDRSIVLFKDEKLWKLRLAVSDNNRAYLLLLGADGRIRWSNSAAFGDSDYARLRSEIEKLAAPHV